MQKPLPKGKVLLLFQSAEEIGEGAKLALESGFFKQFDVDYAYAYHNLPAFPLGTIVCKEGIFTPSVESFSINLIGKNCHASKPADGVNPANAIAEFIQFMATLHASDKSSENYFVVTPIHLNMGEKTYGISAGFAEIGYTIRTFESGVLDEFKQKIINKIKAICEAEKLTFSISFFESFNANNNDLMAFKRIKSAAFTNDFSFIEIEKPLDFGEDFGLFTGHYKGAMFGIGSGDNCPALHTTDYDFPDALIDIGSKMFYAIAAKLAAI
jgi:amidohydrolase